MGKLFIVLVASILVLTSQVINIPACTSGGVNILFKDTQGMPDHTTKANLCHDKKYLLISWENIDEQIITSYTKCNDQLYKEDAVQIFIASPKGYPVNYYEFEVSPKGVIFFAQIINPSGNCSKFSGNPQDCNKVQASGKIMAKSWQANLKIDLRIVQRNEGSNFFYGNLFRLDYTTSKPTRYLAMNPTGTPTPCFHVPSKFQKFVLLGLNEITKESQ